MSIQTEVLGTTSKIDGPFNSSRKGLTQQGVQSAAL